MKRTKRNPAERAYQKGYQAGMNGRSKASCPHADDTGVKHIEWLRGWQEGYDDKQKGFVGVSAIHLLA